MIKHKLAVNKIVIRKQLNSWTVQNCESSEVNGMKYTGGVVNRDRQHTA